MSVFDIGEKFQETRENNGEYTLEKLYTALVQDDSSEVGAYGDFLGMESFVRTIRESYRSLFPSRPKDDLHKMKPEARFQYLQLIFYLGKKQIEWDQQGYHLIKCLKTPTWRYREKASELLEEVLKNIEITPQVLEDITGSGQGVYADSIHTIQQYISLIAYSLRADYCWDISELGQNREKFTKILQQYTEKAKTLEEPDWSCWDEFCLMLAYNRDFCWENDLLKAHQGLQEILEKSRSVGNEFRKMVFPPHPFLCEDDQCLLLYWNGRIVEAPHCKISLTDAEESLKKIGITSYLNALEEYVNDHIAELAEKVFCKNPGESDRKRLKRRFKYVKGYWEMEFSLYHHNCFLTRAKLISIYQVSFLAGPKAGIVKACDLPNPYRAKKDLKENSSLSSSYLSIDTKDPFFHQLICLWTDLQNIRLSVPTKYIEPCSDGFVSINIEALKVICGTDRRTLPRFMQARAESVLFLTVESLIREANDEAEVNYLRQFWERTVGYPLDISLSPSYHRLGAYFRLFSIECIKPLIMPVRGSFSVSLNRGSEGAVVLQNLKLYIRYNPETRCYSLASFPSHSIKDCINAEKEIRKKISGTAEK